MRTRYEVLREFGANVPPAQVVAMTTALRMADRIRELEARVNKLTARNLDLSIECDGLEEALSRAALYTRPTTPTRGSDE